MAEGSRRGPKSLYLLSVGYIASNLNRRPSYRRVLKIFPENVLIDIYFKMFLEGRVSHLAIELTDLDNFDRLVKDVKVRKKFVRCFQAIMEYDPSITRRLSREYIKRCTSAEKKDCKETVAVINLGLRLGGFLADSGWFADSERILIEVRELCLSIENTENMLCLIIQCCHRLLYAQATYCHFEQAAETTEISGKIVEKLKKINCVPHSNLAALFTELSRLYFNRAEYEDSYQYSVEALKHLKSSIPSKVKVDVLRQAAKSCVVKRDFQKAGLLIRQAVFLALEVFGKRHPKYADALLDYGFYLLNVDSIAYSVKIYNDALEIKTAIFGIQNLHVGIAHEDLSYALYVHEYSSGRFYKARDNAEKAISIMKTILPRGHLMLASAQRVKALILEEIALDSPADETELLRQSECLHMAALNLSLTHFGEKNVQTAKHYGNLGRLYQSMKKFEEAESMHLQAIQIKEELLGKEDYEVGLSIGHLASLYNYHMHLYSDAEILYHRSIAISLSLFGETYSGLEYDYRGLVNVYHELHDEERKQEFENILTRWKDLRQLQSQKTKPLESQEPVTVEEITERFFAMCSANS